MSIVLMNVAARDFCLEDTEWVFLHIARPARCIRLVDTAKVWNLYAAHCPIKELLSGLQEE